MKHEIVGIGSRMFGGTRGWYPRCSCGWFGGYSPSSAAAIINGEEHTKRENRE